MMMLMKKMIYSLMCLELGMNVVRYLKKYTQTLINHIKIKLIGVYLKM